MIGNLVGRYETDTKPTYILAARKLTATAYISYSVIITFIIAVGQKGARLIQIATIGKLTAIAHQESTIRNVENDLLGLGVVRVLDQLQRHHVVALQSSQVTSYVSKQVCSVGTTALFYLRIIHWLSSPLRCAYLPARYIHN
jgi:hypothetical protein